MASRRTLALGLSTLAALALVAHSLVWNFVTDDAFISFVYAKNLALHGELVFNLGERVEGYTNFLWTVILAGLLKLGLAPELTSRVLGTACGAATLFVTAALSRGLRSWAREGDGPSAPPDLGWSAWDAVPALLLAGVPGFACWSSGGLETQLFTLLVTLGGALYLRDGLVDPERGPGLGSAACFGLAALTRPEGLLFFGLTALHRAAVKLSRRRLVPTRAELLWAGLFLALVVPHLVWRRAYYGWWLPNTFYIKSSGGAAALRQGGYYLTQVALQFHLWVVPLLLLACAGRAGRGVRLFLSYAAPILLVFALYVASVGGDFMGLFRFVMPAIPPLALAGALGLSAWAARLRLGRAAPALALLALAGHAAHAAVIDRRSLEIGADRGIDTPGYLRWYTADRAAIGKWFGRYARPDDYAAVGGAGAQVYYSGIPSLDCFGLSDAYIAHEVPALSHRPGHQKYAPMAYQLSKRPTIITSAYYRIVGAPYLPSALEAQEWRARGYRYVSVQVPGLSSPWYAFLLRSDRGIADIPPLADGDAAGAPEAREP